MWTAMLILLALALREIYLERWLNRSVCIKTRRQGWLDVEIRRRVAMERLPRHVSEYPVPREERILVNRLVGMVLWHREVSVALPNSACEHLSDVTPQEFDREFPAWLRLVNGAN
ncbi:hypothetical protein [Variovorax sp. GT1P44]|uniref:hypothetical protein n=1 Tax=Variovorax sp. GT1P44 TaxID=3443742 RepID=UPI003F498FE2